jgi:hypothetical protein
MSRDWMLQVRTNGILRKLLLFVPLLAVVNCFPYVYHVRDRVLVSGVDVDATLEIARIELEESGFDAPLTLWAIRDQNVTTENARAISHLYFKYIDKIAAQKDRTAADFGVWHLAWAISNVYRSGDGSIKAELEGAYRDAQKRPEGLRQFKDIASEHINGSKVYMGDFHTVARAYARSHIVVPGNKNYLQSLDEYKKKNKKS